MYLFCTQTDCNQPEMMMIGYDSWLSAESHQAIVEQQVMARSLSLVSVQHTPEHLWLHAWATVTQTHIAAATLSASEAVTSLPVCFHFCLFCIAFVAFINLSLQWITFLYLNVVFICDKENEKTASVGRK